MVVKNRIKSIFRQKRGDEAVSFLFTTAMLIFIFATLVSAMIYIMQYYNASYVCRRVVRSIEIAGKYDETETNNIVNQMKSPDLEDIGVKVDAVYYSGKEIQLRQTFSVTLTAHYKISIIEIGSKPIVLSLPIKVGVSGLSEVFWKT
jgi:hypothetical protein